MAPGSFRGPPGAEGDEGRDAAAAALSRVRARERRSEHLRWVQGLRSGKNLETRLEHEAWRRGGY